MFNCEVALHSLYIITKFEFEFLMVYLRKRNLESLIEFVDEYTYGIPGSANANCLQNSGAVQLGQRIDSGKFVRSFGRIRFDTADPVWVS